MIRAAAALLVGLVVAVPVHAAEVVWRSSSSGVLPSLKIPPIPLPPELAGFSLIMAGQSSVAVGGALDLRPVVSGAFGKLSYLLLGSLPEGATFNAATGQIGGRAMIAGTYSESVLAAGSAGAAAAVSIDIVVT